MQKRLLALGAAAGCLAASSALAIEEVKFSGFLTAGATYASDQLLTGSRNVSQDGSIDNRVTFENDSRLGIQISAKVNPKVDVTGQLLARARDENNKVKADWAFLTYKATPTTSIRAGKVKLTTFLVSDYIEVGYAYPWVRPPQEVYYANPITAINGVDALLRFPVGDSTLLIQPYFGSSRGEKGLVPHEIHSFMPLCLSSPPGAVTYTNCPAGTVSYVDFEADNLHGVNVSIGSEVFTVRAGYLKTKVNAPSFRISEDEATFASIGASLDWKDLVAYTEYFERDVKDQANLAFPNQKGYYATLGYRFGSFLPHVTYAKLDDNDNPKTPDPLFGFASTALKQESTALGFRYELGVGAALKFEAQQIKPEKGTRGLLISAPSTGPERNDTINIYSIAVDVVF